MIDPAIIVNLASMIFVAGAAAGGARAALNGTRKRVERIEQRQETHHTEMLGEVREIRDQMSDVRERVATLEATNGVGLRRGK